MKEMMVREFSLEGAGGLFERLLVVEGFGWLKNGHFEIRWKDSQPAADVNLKKSH